MLLLMLQKSGKKHRLDVESGRRKFWDKPTNLKWVSLADYSDCWKMGGPEESEAVLIEHGDIPVIAMLDMLGNTRG